MPPLIEEGLRENQVAAIKALEKSFARNRLRTLTPQIDGVGQDDPGRRREAYRLLTHGGAEARILFLVDRHNLGKQACDEFRNYVTPDDGRKFGELYNIQLLRSNQIDPAANVVITTIQRLYSILRGEEEFDEELEDESVFERAAASRISSSCRSATSRRCRSSCSTSSSPTSATARSTGAGARSSTTSTPSSSA